MRRLTSNIGIALATACIALTPLIAQDAQSVQENKETQIDVKEPLMIPGHLLQPGKYDVKMMFAMQSRNVVRVSDAKTGKVIANILAVPVYRNRTSGKEELTYWETPAGEPPALKDWFYPGTYYGMQFAYPSKEAAKLKKSAKMKPNEKIPRYDTKGDNTDLNNDTAVVIEILDVPSESPNGNSDNLSSSNSSKK